MFELIFIDGVVMERVKILKIFFYLESKFNEEDKFKYLNYNGFVIENKYVSRRCYFYVVFCLC